MHLLGELLGVIDRVELVHELLEGVIDRLVIAIDKGLAKVLEGLVFLVLQRFADLFFGIGVIDGLIDLRFGLIDERGTLLDVGIAFEAILKLVEDGLDLVAEALVDAIVILNVVIDGFDDAIDDAIPVIGGILARLIIMIQLVDGKKQRACESASSDYESDDAEDRDIELQCGGGLGREATSCVFALLLEDQVVLAFELDHGRGLLAEAEILVEAEGDFLVARTCPAEIEGECESCEHDSRDDPCHDCGARSDEAE